MHLFDARMHPFQTRMTTRIKWQILLLRRKIRGEWRIWSTRYNNSKTRHTIRHQMTNIILTPAKKRLTY